MEPVGAARPGSRSGARAGPRLRAAHWCRERLIAAAPGRWRDGTGSGSWSCRRGCIRAAASPVGRAAATTHRDAARLGRGRPRPHTRPRAQAAPPACRPARSAFFGHRIGIADAHHTGLRVRITTPVSHQVRLFCQLRPPACKVRQIVNVLTRGSPSGAWRKALSSRLNDQVAVPSCSRWGVRAHSARMRCCASAP